jgi:sec-independent protein translocase protein TatB
MFGIAWSEIAVILVVALVLVDPKDMPSVVRSAREFIAKCRDLRREMMTVIHDIDHAAGMSDLKQETVQVNQQIRKIIDLNGNLQDAYDLSDIRPDLHADIETDRLIAKIESVDTDPTKKNTLH